MRVSAPSPTLASPAPAIVTSVVELGAMFTVPYIGLPPLIPPEGTGPARTPSTVVSVSSISDPSASPVRTREPLEIS